MTTNLLSIRTILSQHASLAVPVDQLTDSDDLYAHGLSSLATVEIMLALEDGFDIELPERVLVRSTFESIAAIAEAIADVQTSLR